MKKEELMYGNKLLFLNEVVTFSNISQIREDGIFWIKTIESKIDSKSFHFKPIPLTEEWLLRFGFVQSQDIDTIFGLKLNDFWYINEFQIRNNFNSILLDFELKYVHQLQNLHFALTGTHLILK